MRFKDTDLPQTDQVSLGDLLLLPRASVLFFFSCGSSPFKNKTLDKPEQRAFLPAEREGPNTLSLNPTFYTWGVLETGSIRPEGTQLRSSTGSTRWCLLSLGAHQEDSFPVSSQYLF